MLWLVPYRFVQRTGGDIDFRIMGTFVEFYTTLLGFVNYRLYTSIGLVYPPRFNSTMDAQGGELSAFQIEGKSLAAPGSVSHLDTSEAANPEAQALADTIANVPGTDEDHADTPQPVPVDEEENSETIDKFEAVAPDADLLPQPEATSAQVASLFAPFTFYLSRETPRAPLEFILKAFGCKRVGWDGTLGDGAFTTNESDPSITHQIVDRVPLSATESSGVVDGGAAASQVQWPRSTMPGRTYIQPQWVWDCINQGKLLRPDIYAPGAELPPHLSPWMKPKKGEYDPNLPLHEQELEGEAEASEDEDEAATTSKATDDAEDGRDVDDEDDMDDMDRESSVEAGEGMDVAGSEDEDEDEDEPRPTDEWDGFGSEAESDISEGEAARLQHQRELEAEATGEVLEPEVETTKSKSAIIRKKAERKRREQEEEKERQKMMLSNKKRKLLKRIEYGSNKRDAEAENLRRKKRRLDKSKAGTESR